MEESKRATTNVQNGCFLSSLSPFELKLSLFEFNVNRQFSEKALGKFSGKCESFSKGARKC